MKILRRILLISLLPLFFYACSEAPGDRTLRVGTMSGPETQIMQTAVEVAKEQYDLTVEIVEFTDYLIPNIALANGDIDANAMQHEPFLNKFIHNDSHVSEGDLVIIGKTLLFPIRGYSKKIDNVSQLTENSTIAIPDDPSNKGRALCMLAQYDIIELDSGISCDEMEVYNITSNPLNARIIELEGPSLPRVLRDVELAIINNTFSDAPDVKRSTIILEERKDSPYVNLIVARADNHESIELGLLLNAFQSDEVVAKAHELFGDQALPGW